MNALPLNIPLFAEKKANEIMNIEPISVNAYSFLTEAIALLSDHGVSSLPVVSSEGHLLGLISQSDIIRSFQDEDFELADARVREIMNANIISVLPETPLNEVLQTILEYKLHRVLVVDPQDKLLGILSTIDLLISLGSQT